MQPAGQPWVQLHRLESEGVEDELSAEAEQRTSLRQTQEITEEDENGKEQSAEMQSPERMGVQPLMEMEVAGFEET